MIVFEYFFSLSSMFLGYTNIFVPIFSAALTMDKRTFWLKIPKSGCIKRIGSGISSMGRASTASEPSSLKAS